MCHCSYPSSGRQLLGRALLEYKQRHTFFDGINIFSTLLATALAQRCGNIANADQRIGQGRESHPMSEAIRVFSTATASPAAGVASSGSAGRGADRSSACGLPTCQNATPSRTSIDS